MSILPPRRPAIKQESAEKVARYFLGDNWKTNYPIVEIAVRHKKINFYDDELAVITKDDFKTFNWNAEPSAYIMKGQPKAILKKGVHFYKLSYHHIWNAAKRYVALRPNTSDESLPVWRTGRDGKLFSDKGIAINQHRGGANSTWSEGCQTTHFSQYDEFIDMIGDALGVKVPKGIIKKADARFTKGIGNIPYILIDQADYNYIVKLDENEFDSFEDIQYQRANFANVPRIETVKPQLTAVDGGLNILNALEAEEARASFDDESNFEIPTNSAAVPADIPSENLPISPAVENTESAPATIGQSPNKKNEQSVHDAAQIEEPQPQGIFAKLSGGIGALFSGTAIYTVAEKFGGISISQTVLILIVIAVVLAFLGFCFWAWIDAWKSAQRIKLEAEAKTAVDKKDIVWK